MKKQTTDWKLQEQELLKGCKRDFSSGNQPILICGCDACDEYDKYCPECKAELKGIQEGRLIRENTLADVEEIIDEEIEIITRAKVTAGNTTISKKSLEIVRLFMDERILALEELKQEMKENK